MSLLSKIKQGIQKSGASKGKIVYLKADSKVRIRFLQEITDGIEVLMHDHFDRGINTICQELVGRDCPYCDDEELRHRNAYVFSVWDYEAKEVKLLIGFANNFSHLPALVSMYEAYGTIMDRDYVIQRNGSGTNTSYSVIPMDKVKFKNTNAKPYSDKKMLEILDKAFPAESSIGDDDKSNKKKGKGRGKAKEEEEIEEEEFEDEDYEDDNENEYENMTPRELYMECIERGLDVKKKQKKQYYIDILLEDDESHEDEDWDEDEEDDDDEW